MLEHVPCWWQIGIIEIIETCSTSFWLLDPILGYLHAGDQCQLVSLPQQVVFNHLRVPYLEPKTEGNLQEMETNTWKSAEIRRNPPFAAYFSMTTGGNGDHQNARGGRRRDTSQPWTPETGLESPGSCCGSLRKPKVKGGNGDFGLTMDGIWYDMTMVMRCMICLVIS